MLLKALRESLGQLVVIINFITRPKKLRRTAAAQKIINEQVKSLRLYQFKRCPFCVLTRRHIHKLNLPIEFRDASRGSVFRDELKAGGGKIMVPCLRIEEGGHIQWLYESAAIIDFLQQRFADEKSTPIDS